MKAFVTIAVVLFFSAPAFSYMSGPSNLVLSKYEEHQCFAPQRPGGNNKYDWIAYRGYVDAMRICVNAYTDGAKKDIERINENAKKAIKEYNAIFDEMENNEPENFSTWSDEMENLRVPKKYR